MYSEKTRCSKQSVCTCLRGTGYTVNRSIDIRSMRGVRHAVRGFLARNRGNVPSRIRYPTLSLIIDLGISLVPSVDHPNDRARGERIDISGITTGLIGITGTWTHVPNSGLIRVTDKECHAPVRWINTNTMKATREREREREGSFAGCRILFISQSNLLFLL